MPTHSAAGSHQAGISSERGQARSYTGPRSYIIREVGSGPAKGELALAKILGLGLQDVGWPMQGNGAQ